MCCKARPIKRHPGNERENADQYNPNIYIFNELKLNMPKA